MPKMIWLGLDVHAASISVARYDDDAIRGTATTVPNEPGPMRRLVQRLPPGAAVRACYEAGSCGYALQRQLTTLGVACAVVAPALIPRRPGDRVKTDRRDADKLARLLRAGELTAITVPSPEQEAVRDLVRAREDLRSDLTAARQRLAKFLLRQRVHYTGRHWTKRYREWLAARHFAGLTQTVFEHYAAQVALLEERLMQLTAEVLALAAAPPFAARVARLSCLRGIAPLTAIMLLAELYDLRRFSSPRELMAYVGLVPSEHSSGARTRRGGITKTGNTTVRRLLIEAAWAYRHAARHTARARRELTRQPPPVHLIAERALYRLTTRFRRLLARGKPSPQVATAVARELAGFVWAIATCEVDAA